jgi:hypothetical protein
MIFDVIGDLVADRRQRKQFGSNERIIGLLGSIGRSMPLVSEAKPGNRECDPAENCHRKESAPP